MERRGRVWEELEMWLEDKAGPDTEEPVGEGKEVVVFDSEGHGESLEDFQQQSDRPRAALYREHSGSVWRWVGEAIRRLLQSML